MRQAEEQFYQMVLSFAPGIGYKTTHSLLQHFGSAEAVYHAKPKQLAAFNNMTPIKIQALHSDEVWHKTEKEYAFAQKNNLQIIYPNAATYPSLLNDCNDAPQVLYKKGDTLLEGKKLIAIVGTRLLSEYGARMAEELVKDLAHLPDVIIVSGLAQGIDAAAHRAAIKYNVPTVGVLGHGMHTIYPALHKHLAHEMLEQGGALFTEFTSNDKPDKGNFPMRNRIVAGMSHVTIVVESKIKGGAMITAYLAEGYNREVAAIPGRTSDQRSEGCNHLIRTNVASLITNASDLMQLMNWQTAERRAPKQLKLVLTHEAQSIWNYLQEKEFAHIDELSDAMQTQGALLSGVLLELEMDGLIKALPGKRFRLA